jgi:hypothetical protein
MQNLTNKQINAELNELYGQIYQSECFGTGDLVRYELLLKEAERRELAIAGNIVDKENALYD